MTGVKHMQTTPDYLPAISTIPDMVWAPDTLMWPLVTQLSGLRSDAWQLPSAQTNKPQLALTAPFVLLRGINVAARNNRLIQGYVASVGVLHETYEHLLKVMRARPAAQAEIVGRSVDSLKSYGPLPETAILHAFCQRAIKESRYNQQIGPPRIKRLQHFAAPIAFAVHGRIARGEKLSSVGANGSNVIIPLQRSATASSRMRQE